MQMAVILFTCASFIQEIYGRGKPHVTCEKNYKKIGCFKENGSGEKLQSLFSDRAHNSEYVIDWRNFAASTHSIACRCSEKAKSQGFKYFSIRYWGLCLGGRDLKSLDKALKDPKVRSDNCANPKFQACDDAHEGECVGKARADYLYLIDNAGDTTENVDGGLTNWSEWSPCSETCGTDLMQERERTCTNPLPKGTGKECEGELTEVRSCGLSECPIDGGFSPWNEFSDCSVSCGGGMMKRKRTCNNPPPQFGGAKCVGNEHETKECGSFPCPVDGGYSDWSKFSDCSAKCGDGVQSRTRECNNPAPAFGGRTCDSLGYMEESRACKIKECPVDGGYGEWSEFSACSATCGGGIRRRIRHCDSPAPKHGGKQCIGPKSQTERCNTNYCPVDGGFSDWSDFGYCSVSCGGGTKIRSRSCTNPEPRHGGKECMGHVSESDLCNTKECPVDGRYGKWSGWTTCTKTCGSGSQSRTRRCDNPAPAHGGRSCAGSATETQACSANHCPVDGGWSYYSAYGACSKTCGGGIQMKMRYCTNPTPAYGGKACSGPNTHIRVCNTNNCPVDGSYGSWTGFSSCSKSCGGGAQTRTRKCDSPAPTHGGKDCSRLGHSSETRLCNEQICHTKWSHPYTTLICQNQRKSISCGYGGLIFIDYAMFGRTTRSVCGSHPFARTDCRSGSSYMQVRSRCNNREYCSLYASTAVFGDPCWGTSKYLQVTYKCKGGPYAH